jgi:hypothetical protein
MKYVFLQHPATGDLELRCGFGFGCSHRDLAESLLKQKYAAVSAGHFCLRDDGVVETFGESTSLGLGPHGDDARHLTTFNLLAQKANAREHALAHS